MRSYFLPLFALVLALGGPASSAQQVASSAQINVKRFASQVDDHYNQLKTFKAAFTEIYQGPGISRTESGTLWLKKPGRMRWEYHVPHEKLFLITSDHAYFYVTGEPTARKTSVKNLDDIRSPLRYLLGKTKLEKELEGLSLAPDLQPIVAGDIVLRGVPKVMKDRVSSVILEISPAHQIHRIVIRGVDDSTTDFRFSQIEENIPFQGSLFRFTPPQGVQTIEDNQVTQ
ncbi:MAG TPA: outer membrane lipoprotein carrier protein LolA [Candidatus Angelobacter sp.]|nr:outer membrane lipoprotein carrier protein LolA [Candidatus Angelobacter sp.]